MTRMLQIIVSMLLVGCAGGSSGSPLPSAPDEAAPGGAKAKATTGPREIDPRGDGLEVGLGEWAVTLEAAEIRPGRVTFVVVNRGTMVHGFEIEAEDGGDSSGHGSGDRDGIKAETELLEPGERAELTLNLPAGRYKVECLVAGHDDLGMEGFLEVRPDAPLLRADAGGGREVSISGFAFVPEELEVSPGAEVTWTNDDPAPHTVTAPDGEFDSGTLEPGQAFSVAIEAAGPIVYACLIHPEMTGTIVVT